MFLISQGKAASMTKATDFNIRKSKWRAQTVSINNQLSAPLTIDQIDFRVQSINKGGYATILAYKDARVDMHRLNEVLGPGKWQRKHEFINGRLFCSVGIWTAESGWAWVQDVGTESNAEKEKGQASDSFKRACFNLGIGIELYDYPVIQLKLRNNEFTVDGSKAKATCGMRASRSDGHKESEPNSVGNDIAADPLHGLSRSRTAGPASSRGADTQV